MQKQLDITQYICKKMNITATDGCDDAFDSKKMHGGTNCSPSLLGSSTTNHKMFNPQGTCYSTIFSKSASFEYSFKARSFALNFILPQYISCLQAKCHNFRDF